MRLVATAGGYYGLAFQVFGGVTQGVSLSPTIFNVGVGAVVRHWFDVMVESADKQSGRGQEGRHQNALFYVNGGMVAWSDPRWLQGAFSTLVGLLDRVGLNTNVGKIFGIFCHPCQVAGTLSEGAYGIRMTGTGICYRERQRVWVHCTECGEEMALRLLTVHLQVQHGKETRGIWNW